ncbi:DNA cytosine methyltransferase [Carnobacterium inhibens]|uniref:DNA cytosine methyltransferase n=1 Tax=Carnobacterium inhibens TaxID=147709 RepID=UPI00203E78A8|nr:DNA cytosine methyltransferase [Carnobacterium inhibens]MCM3511669.1 DNA cytosine methyltransferase [Carnobacterium inhibens]
MKFLDLFAGIGGFRFGLESAGHECMGFCEIDKYARKSYKAIHNTEGEVELHDITTIPDDYFRLLRDKVDIIAGGFPCQSFSTAGKREGFADKTKGTLFFEIVRAAKQIKPQFLFLENVKGLLNHDKGNTFRTILSTLDELGYDAEWQLLNSKDFGVPQNRERVFIVGHLRGSGGREIFPIRGTNAETDLQIRQVAQLDTETRKNSNRFRTYEPKGICASLNTMGGGGREPYIVVSQNRIKTVGNIRKNGKSQSGQVVDSEGLSPSICASGLQKNPIKVLIREATKKGYSIAKVGDSINFEHLNSKTRRGRVGKGVAQTLTTSCNQGTIELPAIGASRGRNPLNLADRSAGSTKEQRLEINKQGTSNTLTSVQKDNYVILQKARGNNKGGQHKIAPTVTSNSYQENNILSDGIRIRKLTPKECWRLQGFPDWAFKKAEKVNSNSQLYKQAGNSVTVNVIFEIAKRFE